ncbi:MAG: hypothetical protein N2258_06710 [Brevinematales bacterium]|nr:hypothetical protein [Brevinematales bacterium]
MYKRSLFFIFFLFITSCDEFLLKKSVEIKSLNCNLFFDELNQKIEGNVKYIIENPQTSPINEIYFFCNQNTTVTSIKYRNNNISFDNAFLYGYNIYRIKVPPISPSERQNVELNFTIIGPVEKERFILKKNIVFLDVKEIWLPIPFLSSQKFAYNIRISVPENKYAVIGGKIVSEVESNNLRFQSYYSETDEAGNSGTLIILEKFRFIKDNIYLYTENKLSSPLILDWASEVNSILDKNIKTFDYSQLHIIDGIFQYEDMNLTIEGETFANIIFISNFNKDDNDAKFYKLLAHEISHSYLSGKLNFHPEDKAFYESLIEYLAIGVLNSKSYLLYEDTILNNRFELINLFNNPERNDFLLDFIYNVNFFDAVFCGNSSLYYNLIKILVKKYRFTEIGENEVITTIKELPLELKNNPDIGLINVSAIENIRNKKLYNSFINYRIIDYTNRLSKNRTKIEKVMQLNIFDNFPFEIKANLILKYKNSEVTNSVILKGSETNILIKEKPLAIILSSPFDYLEENLYDNYLYFENNLAKFIENNLNLFYAGEKILGKNFFISKQISSNKEIERIFERDRELTYKLKGKIRIVVDVLKQKDDKIYIMAYKLLNERVFSYIIIKGRIEGNNVILDSVIDPLL